MNVVDDVDNCVVVIIFIGVGSVVSWCGVCVIYIKVIGKGVDFCIIINNWIGEGCRYCKGDVYRSRLFGSKVCNGVVENSCGIILCLVVIC